MTAEQFERERKYSAAIALAKTMLGKALITHQEYGEIRQMFVQKYRPIIGGL